MTQVKYTNSHEWVRPEADGTLTVGITDYAREQLGDVVFVELPALRARIERGEEAGVIESAKAAVEMRMPVRGEIVAVNEALTDDPTLVNRDPTGAGWFFKARPISMADLDGLLDDAAYKTLIGG